MQRALTALYWFLGATRGIIPFIAFLPAIMVGVVFNRLLMGLHAIVFGEMPRLRGFIDRPMALWTGYISFAIPIVAGIAVALLEVAALFAIIISLIAQ